jgi:hypothetical protein
MNLLNEKMDAISGELSRLNGSHLEKFSAEEVASMIEALLTAKFDEEDSEE